jgi:hypothetical protein
MLFAFKLLSNFYIDEYKRLEYVLAWGALAVAAIYRRNQ